MSRTALATIFPDANSSVLANIQGGIVFNHPSSTSNITIVVKLTGLVPNKTHGWHIHTSPVPIGPVNCLATAGHLNPLNATHGAPSNNATKRHVGDLGSFTTDANGNVSLTLTDPLISLFGDFPVTNRAVVIHALEDDLGLVNNTNSLITGNSGARLACGKHGF